MKLLKILTLPFFIITSTSVSVACNTKWYIGYVEAEAREVSGKKVKIWTSMNRTGYDEEADCKKALADGDYNSVADDVRCIALSSYKAEKYIEL